MKQWPEAKRNYRFTFCWKTNSQAEELRYQPRTGKNVDTVMDTIKPMLAGGGGGEMSHAWNKLFTIIQDPLLDRVSCCTRLSLQTALKDAFMLNNSTTHGIDCLRGLSGTAWKRALEMLKAPSEVMIPRKPTTGRDLNSISFDICRQGRPHKRKTGRKQPDFCQEKR